MESITRKHMNLKKVTLITIVCLSVALAVEILGLFLPYALPNSRMWLGYLSYVAMLVRDIALICFLVFLYNRS